MLPLAFEMHLLQRACGLWAHDAACLKLGMHRPWDGPRHRQRTSVQAVCVPSACVCVLRAQRGALVRVEGGPAHVLPASGGSPSRTERRRNVLSRVVRRRAEMGTLLHEGRRQATRTQHWRGPQGHRAWDSGTLRHHSAPVLPIPPLPRWWWWSSPPPDVSMSVFRTRTAVDRAGGRI